MAEPTVYNGRYELHRRLGRGGMADVFLARDQLLDRPVAVKVLFPEFASDPNFVARFRREAQAAANLNHPNIVAVYDWGEGDGESGSTYFIVMEYVEGRTLAEIVKAEGPLHPDRAADVGADVAAALGFAHKNGVLHRDIKPGNVLVTPNGTVKVADWGIGRALGAGVEENLTQTGAVMGTATYFSPEQAQGLELDPRSDLYSLGVVLYELVTGRPPFGGDNPVAIAYKHVQEPPRPPSTVNPDVPEGLDAIILALLAKAPASRYPSAEDVRADLRRFREGETPLALRDRGGAVAAGAAAVGATAMAPSVDATQAVGATRAVVPAGYATGPAYVPVEEVYEEPPRRSSGFLVLLLLLVALLAVLLFFLARSLGGDDVAQVDLPTVVGQPEEAARTTLEGLGFDVRIGDPVEVDDPAQVGLVQSQDPAGGTSQDENSEVTLSIGAEDLIDVPQLEGQTLDQAQGTLSQAGFTGEVEPRDEPNDELAAGLVIRSDPPAGEEIGGASGRIILFVSTGPEAVPVPNVAGQSEADARVALNEAGFESTSERRPDPAVEEGTVVGTDPPAGTPLAPDSNVLVIVSDGPAATPVPAVEGQEEGQAVAAITGAGFEVDVQTVAVNNENQNGIVQDQNPAGNANAEPGSTVTIVVGEFTAPPSTSSSTTTATTGGGGGGGGGNNP